MSEDPEPPPNKTRALQKHIGPGFCISQALQSSVFPGYGKALGKALVQGFGYSVKAFLVMTFLVSVFTLLQFLVHLDEEALIALLSYSKA